MKISLNTIKQYTSVDLTVDELVEKINRQLGGVEEVTDLGKRYEGAVIVRVVQCDDHPNADRLHVCKIDDGGTVEGVVRDENGLVQVVCGAPNVHADMFVVWLPPKSTVPSSFTEKEPFVLDARELRGVVSNGMLASAKELAIGDSHEGILEIDPNEWKPSGVEITPGVRFAEAYGLNDTIIDIENKMFTHRPDLFGQLGVAREIAGIQHNAFTSPDWYKALPEFNRGEGLELAVENEASSVVPRFMAVALKGVEIKPSPLWLQCELVRLGSKPINNIVDVTNYVMLLTAQPTHAYDYDKLRGHKLVARMASEGEKVTLLNGRSYELNAADIVIADGEGPVGLAGIMGGSDSEVSAATKNIVLEVATFDMYAVRKSSMRHGLFTDALTRFNKGQSPLQNDHVLSLLIRSVLDVSPGEQASEVFDRKVLQSEMHGQQAVSRAFINERLGLELSSIDVSSLLRNVEFIVEEESDEIRYTAPFWRTDIELSEDIVEEVGRLYGFDRLPRVLPARSTKPAPRNEIRVLKQHIRESLAKSGANEVLTYTFVHENVLRRAGQNPEEAFRLGNALSPDLQYYRLSVLPSLLDKVHANIKAGFGEFTLFELGKGHHKQNVGEDGLPTETDLLELVYASRKPREGAAYYRMRRTIEALLRELGVGVVFEPIPEAVPFAGMAPYDFKRSAFIKTIDGTSLGVVGELTAAVRKGFKLPDYTAAATLDIASILGLKRGISYKPLPRFPKVSQDISLKVPEAVTFSSLFKLVDETVRAAEISSGYALVEPRTIYRPDETGTKTITIHVEVASESGTLTDQQVGDVLGAVAERAASEL